MSDHKTRFRIIIMIIVIVVKLFQTIFRRQDHKSLFILGKKVFLLTNSPYGFTNVVMKYILDDLTGKKWTDYFEYIIVSACKPKFFNEGTPFR